MFQLSTHFGNLKKSRPHIMYNNFNNSILKSPIRSQQYLHVLQNVFLKRCLNNKNKIGVWHPNVFGDGGEGTGGCFPSLAMRIFINIRDLYDDCENRIFSILSSARDVREPAFFCGKTWNPLPFQRKCLKVAGKKRLEVFIMLRSGEGLKTNLLQH